MESVLRRGSSTREASLLPACRRTRSYMSAGSKTLCPSSKETSSAIGTFLHVDCDLYSSTKTIFDTIGPNVKDTVVEFDELLEYDGFKDHELKALWEFMCENRGTMTYDVLSRSGECVAMRLTKV